MRARAMLSAQMAALVVSGTSQDKALLLVGVKKGSKLPYVSKDGIVFKTQQTIVPFTMKKYPCCRNFHWIAL